MASKYEEISTNLVSIVLEMMDITEKFNRMGSKEIDAMIATGLTGAKRMNSTLKKILELDTLLAALRQSFTKANLQAMLPPKEDEDPKRQEETVVAPAPAPAAPAPAAPAPAAPAPLTLQEKPEEKPRAKGKGKKAAANNEPEPWLCKILGKTFLKNEANDVWERNENGTRGTYVGIWNEKEMQFSNAPPAPAPAPASAPAPAPEPSPAPAPEPEVKEKKKREPAAKKEKKSEPVPQTPQPQPQPQTPTSVPPADEIEPLYVRRKNIPKHVKTLVWGKYIGNDKPEAKCCSCRHERIDIRNFHCGHVLAEANGGTCTIDNLRPICAPCNSSMSTMSMNEFTSKYFGWTV